MRPRAKVWGGLVLVALLGPACSKDDGNGATPDGGGTDSAVPVLPVDGGPCLDTPSNLPRPGNQLPCELLPPNFGR